jgi:hypothetical protein
MPWQKGKSGNPGGRPREIAEVRGLARQHTAAAIKRLAHWMDSDDARASVAASVALLDRGWGRSPQAIAHTGADGGPIRHARDVIPADLSSLTEDELLRLAAAVTAH